MTKDDMVFKLAFSFLKKANANLVRETENKGVSPEEFFLMPGKELNSRMNFLQDHSFDNMIREEALSNARKELQYDIQHNIQPLFLLDDNYPERLKAIEDAPIVIYKLGETDLESEHMLSIVGTRRPTPYGIEAGSRLVDDIGGYFNDAIIVSGLAFGIDAMAHKKALENDLKTVAVVAHGLNMIYPAEHRNLAREIIKKGGAILSEYPFGVKPYKPNFLARNRIVAALSDATIVIESAIKGGAMSTANFAFSYSRDVMALPGRAFDVQSQGCNLLIRKQKATLIECGADLIEVTGWKPMNIKVVPQQRNLFPELEGEASKIYEMLKFSSEPATVDQICQNIGISASKVIANLGELEFDGIVVRYPGNRYSIS